MSVTTTGRIFVGHERLYFHREQSFETGKSHFLTSEISPFYGEDIVADYTVLGTEKERVGHERKLSYKSFALAVFIAL